MRLSIFVLRKTISLQSITNRIKIMRISWFSGGVSSAVATKIALSSGSVKIIYIDILDQHPDTYRFISDCERWYGQKIEVLKSDYASVDIACRMASFLVSPWGAACTSRLKKNVRKKWELDNPGRHTYIWGMDLNEKGRVNRLIESNFLHNHEFPLV